MLESLKPTIKLLAKKINDYAQDKTYHEIEEIANILKTLFDAETVNFWHVDTKKEEFTLIAEDKREPLSLDTSLIKQAIDSKKILIDNHVTSGKYYNQEIDNPLELKIKALIILPVLKGKNVIGIVKIWRGIRQRKVFSKKDEEKCSYCLPLLVKLFKAEEIEKDELLSFLDENADVLKSKVTANVSTLKDKALDEKLEKLLLENSQYKEELKNIQKSKDKAFQEKEDEALTYKNELNALQKSYNLLKKENEKSNKNDNEQVLQTKISDYDKELALTKEKYKELEVSSMELYTESQLQQSSIKELEKELALLHKENQYLSTEVKEKEKNTKSLKELKSEKSFLSNASTSDVEQNIELLLKRVDNHFSENENAYMLFEMMLYALYSKKGMTYIEENIKKSKIVPNIIDRYYFQGDIQVHNEKYRISDLVEHIKSYEKNIFAKMVTLTTTVDENVPTSLVFDAAKIQSTILHLLIDLHQFVDHSNPVNVRFSFKDKFLHIEIGGSIHKKNSLFQSMFKQTKLGGDEKDRIGLQLSKKLIGRLKGKIDYLYEDDYYKFIVTVPTQVIKL